MSGRKLVKKLFLFVILLQVSIISSAANWVRIDSPLGYADPIYYDSSSLVRQGDYVTVWIKNSVAALQRQVVDCGHQKYLLLFVKAGPEQEMQNFSNNTDWIAINPSDQYTMNVQRSICLLYQMRP